MALGRRLRALWVGGCLVVGAPGLSYGDVTSPANEAAARRHFDAARDDYSKGAYKEAIAELEAAHALDPNAKDLVFNLGVVHEKLADIEEALRWFHLYTTLDPSPQERDRAEAYIRRLEGAEKELEDKQAAARAQALAEAGAPAQPPPPTRSQPEPPPHGRMDAATVTTATLTLGALAFGVVMGLKALRDKPGTDFVTGVNGSYPALVNLQDTAHREAIVADVGFGVAALGAVTTAVLYFARRRDPTPVPSVALAPAPGGGSVVLQGSF